MDSSCLSEKPTEMQWHNPFILCHYDPELVNYDPELVNFSIHNYFR